MRRPAASQHGYQGGRRLREPAGRFAVKERRDFKSESLVDALYSIYEQNFQIIDQLIFRTSIYQKKLKYSQELPMSLNLSSDYNVPDIQLGINYLSSFTAALRVAWVILL